MSTDPLIQPESVAVVKSSPAVESRFTPKGTRPQLPTEELIARAAELAEQARLSLLREHLTIVQQRQKVSVRDFREAAGLGAEASDVLQRYEAQGYLQSQWKTARRWYSLTDAGVAILPVSA